LTRAIPVSAQLPRYRVPSARRDLVAGVTVAALALPAAMAYAEVAGLSPVSGLYALLLPTVAYVLFGSSRQLIIGPEGSISTLVAAAILTLAAAASPDAAELAAMLALLVAVCFALAWLLRLGWIADYFSFSRPVLVGYIHGVAVVLIIGQLGELLGLSIEARDPLPQLREVLRELGSISGLTVALAGAALALLFALRRFMPSVRRHSSSSSRSHPRGSSICRRTASRSSAQFPQVYRASICRALPGRMSSDPRDDFAWKCWLSARPRRSLWARPRLIAALGERTSRVHRPE
jgi:MFS superfamily sulfate permease-like transporter